MKNAFLFLFPALLALETFAGEVAFTTVATTRSQPERAYATASEGPYFGIFGGAALSPEAGVTGQGSSITYDGETGGFFGMELGYAWRTPFILEPAMELEGFYYGNEYNLRAGEGRGGNFAADLKAGVVMANFILNLNFSAFEEEAGSVVAGLKPYVGVGVGGAYLWSEAPGGGSDALKPREDNGFTFAYQFLGGLEVAMTDGFGIYAEYRYLTLGEVGSWATDHTAQLVGAGLRFSFD